MNCQQFKDHYNLFTSQNNDEMTVKEDKDTYYTRHEHRHECENCGEWYMKQQAFKAGVKIEQFPCVHLAYYSRLDCHMHTDPFECPDVLIVETNNGLALPIIDSSAFVKINFCPWCGKKTSDLKGKAPQFKRIDI